MNTQKNCLIDDHEKMLEIRKKSVNLFWNKRDNEKDRDMLRWAIQQAKFHRHMIAQISSMPEIPSFGFSFR